MFQINDYLTDDGRIAFKEWLSALTDKQAKSPVLPRVLRMTAGNFGDCKPLQNGVWELRIDHGLGYRVYYAQTGNKLLLLLIGGDKSKQQSDINKALNYRKDWNRRTHHE